MPLHVLVEIGKQLAGALSKLHEDAHVVHFDVKPENILMGKDGRCVLADFNIAHQFKKGQTTMKLPHDAYGSERYMAPEQALEAGPGASYPADVWGLGCTLLDLATGHHPYAVHSNTMNVRLRRLSLDLKHTGGTAIPRAELPPCMAS